MQIPGWKEPLQELIPNFTIPIEVTGVIPGFLLVFKPGDLPRETSTEDPATDLPKQSI